MYGDIILSDFNMDFRLKKIWVVKERYKDIDGNYVVHYIDDEDYKEPHLEPMFALRDVKELKEFGEFTDQQTAIEKAMEYAHQNKIDLCDIFIYPENGIDASTIRYTSRKFNVSLSKQEYEKMMIDIKKKYRIWVDLETREYLQNIGRI